MSVEPADAAQPSGQAALSSRGAEWLQGLEPDHRFRCEACGNVTRFDVVVTQTTRRFHHFDLGGASRIEEEEVLAQEVASVTCRWCSRQDAIRVEPAPAPPLER